jgi:hypothetical protein
MSVGLNGNGGNLTIIHNQPLLLLPGCTSFDFVHPDSLITNHIVGIMGEESGLSVRFPMLLIKYAVYHTLAFNQWVLKSFGSKIEFQNSHQSTGFVQRFLTHVTL